MPKLSNIATAFKASTGQSQQSAPKQEYKPVAESGVQIKSNGGEKQTAITKAPSKTRINNGAFIGSKNSNVFGQNKASTTQFSIKQGTGNSKVASLKNQFLADLGVTYNNGNYKVGEMKYYRTLASDYARSARTEDDRQFFANYEAAIDSEIYNHYTTRIRNLEESEKYYSKLVTDAQNAARSAADAVNFYDDPYGLFANEHKQAQSRANTLQQRYNAAQKLYNDAVAKRSQLQDEFREYSITRGEYEAQKRLEADNYTDPNLYATDPSMLFQGQTQKQKDQATMDAYNTRTGNPEQYYNARDKIGASARSAAMGIGSAVTGLASLTGKALLASGDSQARTEYDKIHGTGAYDKLMEDSKLSMLSYEEAQEKRDSTQAQIDLVLKQIDNLNRTAGGITPDIERQIKEKDQELKKLKQDLKLYDDTLKAYNGETPSLDFRLTYGDGSGTFARIDALTDQLDEKSAKEIAKAKVGTGKIGSLLLDAEKTTIEIGFDTAVGAITGGGTLLPMFFRVLGNESSAARREGADVSEQLLYGTAKGLIEVATEKIFGIEGFGYGKGFAGGMSEKLVHYLAQSPFGKNAMRAMLQMNEEGMEEVLSTLLSPLAKKIYSDKSLKDISEEEYASLAYDYLLGAFLGGTGAVTGLSTGEYAHMNYEQYQGDIRSDLARNTKAMLEASEKADATRAKPDSAAGKYLYGKEARTSNQETHDINKILKNPKALSEFERATDQKVEGETFDEKRESVRQIKDSGETAASKIINKAYEETTSKNTPISKAIDKHRHGEQLTKHEANLLYAAGLISRAERDQINLTAPSYIDENGTPKSNIYNSVLGWKGRNQDAYIAANEQSVARKAAEAGSMPKEQAEQKAYQDNADKIHNAVEASNANAQQEVDKRDTMEMRSEGVLQDGTKRELILRRSEETGEWIVGYQDNYNPDLSKSFAFKDLKSAVQRYHKIEGGFATKTEAPSQRPTAAPQAQEDSGDTDIAPAPTEEVKPAEESATEKAEERPAPEAQKQEQKPAPQPAQQTQPGKGTTKEERAAYWRQKNEERKAKNEERRLADNAEIEKAEADKTDVSFEITMFGRPHTVTYDGDSKTYVVHNQNGEKIFFLDNHSNRVDSARGGFKSWLNKYRRDTGSTQPAGPAIEAVAEEQTTPEPAQPAEESETAKAIRNATSMEELQEMFGKDPDSFGDAYKEIMGEELPKYESEIGDAIYRLYQAKEISDQTDIQDQSDTQSVGEPAETQAVEEKTEEPAIEPELEPAKAEEPVEPDQSVEVQPEPAKGPEKAQVKGAVEVADNGAVKTVKQKPAKEPVSYDELMTGEVDYSRIDKHDPEYARFIQDTLGKPVDMNNTKRQYGQAINALAKQAEAPTESPKTGKPKTDIEFAEFLLNGRVHPSQMRGKNAEEYANFWAGLIESGSKPSNELDDILMNNFPDTELETAMVFRDWLKANGIKAEVTRNNTVIDGIENYDSLTKPERKQVQAKIAEALLDMGKNYRGGKKGLGLDETDTVPLTGEEGENNATTLGRREGRNLGRIHSGDYEAVQQWFIRRSEERGGSRQSGEANARAWQENIREYTDNGAKVISEQDVDDDHYTAAEALTANDALPCVTYIDVSGMKNPPKMRGFVDAAHPETGLYMFINNPAAVGNKVTEGIGVKHEPFHYFVAQYRAEHNGENPDFDAIIREIAKRSIHAKTKAEANQFAAKLMALESRFSCRAIFDRISEETGFIPTDQQIKDFKSKDFNGQDAALVDWIGDDGAVLYWSESWEELLANLAAGNEALNDGTIVLKAVQYYAREVYGDMGFGPKGYFDSLDKSADAIDLANAKKMGAVAKGTPGKTGQNIKGLDLAQDIYAERRTPFETGTAQTTNANAYETLTAREQAQVGEGTHESISHHKSEQQARKNIRDMLRDPEVGFENIWNHFKDMKPNDLSVQDDYEIRAFATALNNELRSRGWTGGRIFDKNLPADTNRLSEIWQKAQALAKQTATREGQGLQAQRSTTNNYEKTLNNSAKEFLGVEATDDVLGLIDPDSIGAKMFGITDDHVRYQQSIDDRLEDGVIDMNEALKLKRQELEEVNKIRDVNAVFGPASGKLMAAWEQKAIDRIIKHNTPENAYRIISDMALASVNRIASDFRSVGAVNTIKQIRYLNMLSNVATIVNNVLNNAESSFTGAFAQNIARATNYRVAKIMDQKGYDVLPKNSNLGWYPGFLPGRKNRELNEYMITKAAESVLSLYYGLDTNNAFVDDSTLAENASKRFDFDVAAKHNQTDDYLGRLLARFQFLSGLGMVTTDEMAISRAYRGMEMNIDNMKNATPEHKAYLKQIAQQTALAQMYHNTDGAMSQVMSKLRDWGNQFHIGDPNNGGSIGFGDIVMPFVNVPANVASRAMRATPIGAVAGMIQYINGMRRLQQQADHFRAAEDVRTKIANKEGLTADDQVTLSKYRNVKMPTDAEIAKVQLKFGESVTNAAITAVGYALAALGAIKDFDDEDDEDLKRIAREKGMTGLQVNISRLWGKDWDDDDVVTIGGSWLEVMAIPITIGYQIWKDVQDPDANALKTIAMSPLSSLNTLLDAAQEVPGIKQVSEIWNAYENLQYEDTLDEKVGKVWASVAQYGANTATTFVIPNLVSQAAAGMDNTVRDVYNADSTKEIARNIFYNKVPGLRQKLPEAKDSEGNVRKYGENAAMGVLNRMILPGTGIQVYSKSPLQKEWERLIANGADGKGMIPKKSAPSYIELNDKKYDLNAEERRAFDDEYTENTVNLQKQAIEMPEYKALSDGDKEQVLNDISTLTQLVSKKDTLKAKGVEDELNLKSWQKAYIDDTEDLPYYLTAKYSLKSIYDEGEFKDYAKMDEWIKDVWPNLDKAGQDVILNDEAQIDDIYSASKVGIDAETYSKLKETQQKYSDMQDYYRDVDNGPSLTALSRDMIVDFENIVTDKAQRKWAQENLRLWQTLPASNDTLEKWQKETSLTTKEIDSWKDVEEAMKPLGGYKNPSQNQKLMAIRDFNGISARNQKDLEKKRWEMIEMIASKGEDKDGDEVGDGGAWANLKPYMDQGYSVAYALDHATYWYKDGKRWVKRKYNTIYPAD